MSAETLTPDELDQLQSTLVEHMNDAAHRETAGELGENALGMFAWWRLRNAIEPANAPLFQWTRGAPLRAG